MGALAPAILKIGLLAPAIFGQSTFPMAIYVLKSANANDIMPSVYKEENENSRGHKQHLKVLTYQLPLY